jgi:hypothetical protein
MAKTQKTKKERAIALVERETEKGKTRGQILAQLQTRLEMTLGGAKNYYQRIMSGTW